MAVASARVSRLGHGLSLLSSLEECGGVDVLAANNLRTDTSTGWSAFVSVSRDHGQSVKTTERGGIRGFDGHKRVKGRKRHILVDTLGLLIASRVEPANVSDRRAGERLLAGLSLLFPRIQTVIADAGHQSRRLARRLLRDAAWKLQIVEEDNWHSRSPALLGSWNAASRGSAAIAA